MKKGKNNLKKKKGKNMEKKKKKKRVGVKTWRRQENR